MAKLINNLRNLVNSPKKRSTTTNEQTDHLQERALELEHQQERVQGCKQEQEREREAERDAEPGQQQAKATEHTKKDHHLLINRTRSHLSFNSNHHRRISLKKLFTNLPIISNINDKGTNNNKTHSLYNYSTSLDHQLSHNSADSPDQLELLDSEPIANSPSPPPHPQPLARVPRRSISEPAVVTQSTQPAQKSPNDQPSSPHHLTPFRLITSKLRPNRQPSPRLKHSSSVISLADAIKSSHPPTPSPSSATTPPTQYTDPDPTNFSLKSFRNVNATLLDSPSSTHPHSPLQQLSPSSLSLPLLIPPVSNTSTRPPSLTTISRPSSPSSKISAAAFREARAARYSRSITSTSLIEPPSIPRSQSTQSDSTKYIKHTRFKSSPQHRFPSHIPSPRPASLAAHDTRKSIMTLAELNRTSHRYQTFDSIDQTTHVRLQPTQHAASASLYNDNEALIPPRPPFYGSRLPNRSTDGSDPRFSLYYPPPSNFNDNAGSSRNRRTSSGVNSISLYAHPFINQSSTSVRSVPSTLIQPPTPLPPYPRRRSATSSKSQFNSGQPQLDRWHSDEEDDHLKPSTLVHPLPKTNSSSQFSNSNTKLPLLQPRPRLNSSDVKSIENEPNNKDDEDDEDEVPLSRLKKKSLSSLRGTAAAQTLARERQQLHNISHPVPSGFLQPPSPLGGSHTQPQWVNTNHNRHLSSSFLPNHRDSSINPHRNSKFMTDHGAQCHLPMRAILQPRGNSPASSSSGSGSGTWSIPITPRNSTGNLNLSIPSAPAGYQHHPLISNFAQDPYKSRFSVISPKYHFDQSRSDAETMPPFANPSKTPTKARSLVNPEPQKVIWNHGVAIEDMKVPPVGVDPFLYSTLSVEQKIELHHRSELMKQMMAAQAQAAVQMHAMALSTAAGSPRQTGLDDGIGSSLEYDPTRMMYNRSASLSADLTASNKPINFQAVDGVVASNMAATSSSASPSSGHVSNTAEDRRPGRITNHQQT